MSSVKKYLSEFIGTFVLVLFGCGTAVVTGAGSFIKGLLRGLGADSASILERIPSGVNVVATSLAFGLVIVAMAYSIGNVSGCHINPAVSIAMLCSKKMSVKDFIGYVASQILGAIAGSAVLWAIIGKDLGLGQNGLYDGSIVKSLIIEVILTFVFVLVILFVTSKKEHSNKAGIVIGLTLTLVHLIGINLTGTSVNPARSLAPAIFVGGDALKDVWVFIVAPLVGGIIASLCFAFLNKEDKPEEKTEATEEKAE